MSVAKAEKLRKLRLKFLKPYAGYWSGNGMTKGIQVNPKKKQWKSSI